MDVVDSAKRSAMMAGIRSKDTRPEMRVRRFLHAEGFRFLLHDKKLPGKPDLVFPKYRTALFVHGCFWHQHPQCKYATMPSSNRERWQAKFSENTARDTRSASALRQLGWTVVIVWECELRGSSANARLVKLVDEIAAGPAIQTVPA